MIWITLGAITAGALGGIAVATSAGIYVKQALIDRALSDTNGYF